MTTTIEIPRVITLDIGYAAHPEVVLKEILPCNCRCDGKEINDYEYE